MLDAGRLWLVGTARPACPDFAGPRLAGSHGGRGGRPHSQQGRKDIVQTGTIGKDHKGISGLRTRFPLRSGDAGEDKNDFILILA